MTTPPSTILVVDDDPDLRDVVRSTLEPEGHRVLEAPDGQAALDLIQKEVPALLILDYSMPRMDGPSVCRALKQDLLLRHVPIIMLTGRSEVQDKVFGLNAGADDYVIKPFEPQELLARVRMVLRRTAQELEANPLTKLPGNVSIQHELEERLATGGPLAVCYCDLDHFKQFNDHYGFERGDLAITKTAQVLLEVVKQSGRPTDFIGHIGGDDFVVITIPARAETVSQAIIDRFDAMALALYDDADRQRGYVMHTDRKGQPVKLGFLTISIAVVTNEDHRLTHLGQIAQIGAELKAYAKQLERSVYVKERRKPPA